jgi:DNA polymerase-3 subunit beta
VTTSELMTIGAFARRSGLTASALRFYADAGLVTPAEVDASTGYRFYHRAQIERAALIRRLRAIAMPLDTVRAVLDAGPEEALRLIDEHVAALADGAAAARERAGAIKASLTGAPRLPLTSVSGPVFAAAADQVLTASSDEPGLAVLDSVRFHAGPDAVTLTATDRYRLAMRTLVPDEPPAMSWAATVSADDLRGNLTRLRRSPRVGLDASHAGLWLRFADGGEAHCRVLTDDYPDCRSMLDRLPEPGTRVAVGRTPLLRGLEAVDADRIVAAVTEDGIALRPAHDPAASGAAISAAVTGPGAVLCFAMTTLYPAVSAAIGADLLIDLRGPDRPATIRSADNGDLTTLVMPLGSPAETSREEKTVG